MVLILLETSSASGAEGRLDDSRKLIVGTKQAPPFSMKTEDGEWTGLSIELWKEIAKALGYTFEFREFELKPLLEAVVNGKIDVAVAALTISTERERVLDFTHAFFSTGLGIAVAEKKKNPWIAVLQRLFSPAFLKIVAALVLILIVVGLLIWWFERKKNPGHFGGSAAKGIGSGFWWSAVTMTTVGYGDKVPLTFAGRLVSLIWMFVAMIVLSGFIATITSSLTVTSLESSIKGPEDLPKIRVGTVLNTTSESYLQDERIPFLSYASLLEGLQELKDGRIDAMVYDAPLLQYRIQTAFKDLLTVLPNRLSRQDYGFALPEESPLLEPINVVLLEKIYEKNWQDKVYLYLGEK